MSAKIAVNPFSRLRIKKDEAAIGKFGSKPIRIIPCSARAATQRRAEGSLKESNFPYFNLLQTVINFYIPFTHLALLWITFDALYQNDLHETNSLAAFAYLYY